jgi:hypothetical protein
VSESVSESFREREIPRTMSQSHVFPISYLEAKSPTVKFGENCPDARGYGSVESDDSAAKREKEREELWTTGMNLQECIG